MQYYFVAISSLQFRLKPGIIIIVHCIILYDLHVQYIEMKLIDV